MTQTNNPPPHIEAELQRLGVMPHIEAELQRLGVMPPKPHYDTSSAMTAVHEPKPWKPSFEGEDPPF